MNKRLDLIDPSLQIQYNQQSLRSTREVPDYISDQIPSIQKLNESCVYVEAHVHQYYQFSEDPPSKLR